jgi:hypothetical protein
MFAWLEGPGKAYKRPKPGVTNYLVPEAGARRGGRGGITEMVPNGPVTPADQAEELIDKLNSVPGGPEKDRASASEVGAVPLTEEEQYFDAMKRLKKARDSSTAGRSDMVEENLNPFPLNPWFRSQPVLSEELKEDIYKKVKQGKTVREVSEDYRVSMERVGAVVRMKEMEHDWLEQVRRPHNLFFLLHNDEHYDKSLRHKLWLL